MVELRGLMVNRLIVLIQIFAFPAYFYVWFLLGPMKDLTLDKFFFWTEINPLSGTGELVILKVLSPLIFALPFTLFSIVKANRISDTYELMWRSLGKVRIDTRLFYFVNAIFCLFFFILPFGGPILAVFGAFFAVKLLLYAFGIKKHVPAILIVIPGLFLAAIPLMVTIAFYSEYQLVMVPILSKWSDIAPIFYGAVLCLACAIAIGNFFIFLREGASQVSYTKPVQPRIALFIKGGLLGGIVLLYGLVSKWDPAHTSMYIINIVAVVLGVLETVIRWRKKFSKANSNNGGSFMVAIFIAVNFVARFWAGAISIIIGLSGFLFFALFLYAYKSATDETLFDR